MPLLNYSTSINAEKTISEISKCLAMNGANAILTEYDADGSVNSLSFKITMNENPIGFKLPCNWKPVLALLEQDRKVPRSLCHKDQAIKVAWRIVKVWIVAQMALLETQMVSLPEIFLPYAVTQDGRTFYQTVEENGYLLASPK